MWNRVGGAEVTILCWEALSGWRPNISRVGATNTPRVSTSDSGVDSPYATDPTWPASIVPGGYDMAGSPSCPIRFLFLPFCCEVTVQLRWFIGSPYSNIVAHGSVF